MHGRSTPGLLPTPVAGSSCGAIVEPAVAGLRAPPESVWAGGSCPPSRVCGGAPPKFRFRGQKVFPLEVIMWVGGSCPPCECVEGHLRHSASGGRKFFLLRSPCGLVGATPRECVEGHLRNSASGGRKFFPLEAIRKPAPRGAGIDRPACQIQAVKHGSPVPLRLLTPTTSGGVISFRPPLF